MYEEIKTKQKYVYIIKYIKNRTITSIEALGVHCNEAILLMINLFSEIYCST